MKILKAIFNFYIESSIHVALAICALAGVTVLTFDLVFEWPVFAFIFLASITGYNFVKYAGKAKLHHRSLTHQLRAIQIFSLVCFLLLIYVTFLQSIDLLITTSVLGVFTFFYAVPFLPNQKNLRSLKSLKIFIIALVWAGTTLWLPIVHQHSLFSMNVALETFSYFIFVLALILPFEIRDLKFDYAELGTFPQRFGISKTKIFGYVLLLVFIIVSFLIPLTTIYESLIRLGVALLIGVFLWFSSRDQPNFYTAFWVEAVPVFWFLGLWLVQA